ncbi:MAG: hypothetical protein V7749_17155 [Cocleimonas sp.]
MIYEINPKYSSIKPFIENIETYFQKSSHVLYDQRNVIRVVNYENENYVVKKFRVPNLVNRFAYRYLRPSKAKRSYLYSLKIGAELSPEPIAYIEQSKNALLATSYYISKYFEYDQTIHEVLINKELGNRERILKDFSDFTYKLHELEILHHDYSHGNILMKKSIEADSTYEFKIIDVNRMEFKSLDLKTRLESFARINADDIDMETIITQYAKNMDAPVENLLKDAKFYRDDFYQKRALKHKLRGK